MTDTPETILLRHVLETPAGAIPAEARAAARRFMADTLAVGLAGTAHPAQPGLLAAASRWGAGDEAGVWGKAIRLPAGAAAFANAFAAHSLEFDAIHEGAVAHAMTPTLAAALAEAERQAGQGRPVDGAALVEAVVLGLDLACGIGAAARGKMRFFRPATAGMFGAFGAVARLRGFDLARGSAGAGLMLGQIPGTMQAHHEGSVALAVQMGFAAAAAFRAADLAEAGIAGPAHWLAGPSGFLAMTEPDHDLGPTLATLGHSWQVTAFSHKPFPSGRLTHAAIDGTRRAMAGGGVDVARIAEVRLHIPPLAMRLVGRPLLPALEANYARLCLPYVVATTLRFGTVGLADFTAPRLADPATLALAAKVRVLPDGNADETVTVPQAVEILQEGAAPVLVRVEAALGSPANPLSAAEERAKAGACAAAARHPMSPARLDALLRLVAAIEGEADAGVLVRAMLPA